MVCRENILCKIFVQLSMARDFFPLFLKCASFTLFLFVCKKGGLCFFFFFPCASHFLFFFVVARALHALVAVFFLHCSLVYLDATI